MPGWLLLFPIVIINVCASLLLKTGANLDKAPFLLNLLSWRSFWGLACFGLGGLAYAWILRFVPLGVAQAVLASQYVFTVLAAWLFLHEHIDLVQATGFFLVAIGIALVVSR